MHRAWRLGLLPARRWPTTSSLRQYEPFTPFRDGAVGRPAGRHRRAHAGRFPLGRQHLALDFYMVSYYNPSPRDQVPHHDPATIERYADETATSGWPSSGLRRPGHPLQGSGGRAHPPMRPLPCGGASPPADAICVGIHTGDNPTCCARMWGSLCADGRRLSETPSLGRLRPVSRPRSSARAGKEPGRSAWRGTMRRPAP